MKKQPELFPVNQEHLYNQLIKLGDMMGDGLHHEEPWIAKEYKKVMNLLHPEINQEIRKRKADNVNIQMRALLLVKKCECGCAFKQARSGSKIAYCRGCGRRVKATSKRKINEI